MTNELSKVSDCILSHFNYKEIAKNMKKRIWAVLAALALAATASVSAAAITPDSESVSLYTGNVIIETENESTIMPRAGFTISSSRLTAESTTKSVSTYYIEEGEDSLEYSMNWSPTGQDVKIGFKNKESGTLYLTSAKSGGSASGTVSTVGVPDGEYYVVVFACSDNTASVSVNATCEWLQ